MSIKIYGDSNFPQAIFIPANARAEGIEFYSPSDFPQQIGLMSRPKNYVVPAHVHNQVTREISLTQEVLLLRVGKCLIELLNESMECHSQIEMNPGDVVLLGHGIHRVTMLEDSELLEVKQGPYLGNLDKKILE